MRRILALLLTLLVFLPAHAGMVYRSDGPWGSGIHRPLTWAQMDANWYNSASGAGGGIVVSSSASITDHGNSAVSGSVAWAIAQTAVLPGGGKVVVPAGMVADFSTPIVVPYNVTLYVEDRAWLEWNGNSPPSGPAVTIVGGQVMTEPGDRFEGRHHRVSLRETLNGDGKPKWATAGDTGSIGLRVDHLWGGTVEVSNIWHFATAMEIGNWSGDSGSGAAANTFLLGKIRNNKTGIRFNGRDGAIQSFANQNTLIGGEVKIDIPGAYYPGTILIDMSYNSYAQIAENAFFGTSIEGNPEYMLYAANDSASGPNSGQGPWRNTFFNCRFEGLNDGPQPTKILLGSNAKGNMFVGGYGARNRYLAGIHDAGETTYSTGLGAMQIPMFEEGSGFAVWDNNYNSDLGAFRYGRWYAGGGEPEKLKFTIGGTQTFVRSGTTYSTKYSSTLNSMDMWGIGGMRTDTNTGGNAYPKLSIDFDGKMAIGDGASAPLTFLSGTMDMSGTGTAAQIVNNIGFGPGAGLVSVMPELGDSYVVDAGGGNKQLRLPSGGQYETYKVFLTSDVWLSYDPAIAIFSGVPGAWGSQVTPHGKHFTIINNSAHKILLSLSPAGVSTVSGSDYLTIRPGDSLSFVVDISRGTTHALRVTSNTGTTGLKYLSYDLSSDVAWVDGRASSQAGTSLVNVVGPTRFGSGGSRVHYMQGDNILDTSYVSTTVLRIPNSGQYDTYVLNFASPQNLDGASVYTGTPGSWGSLAPGVHGKHWTLCVAGSNVTFRNGSVFKTPGGADTALVAGQCQDFIENDTTGVWMWSR